MLTVGILLINQTLILCIQLVVRTIQVFLETWDDLHLHLKTSLSNKHWCLCSHPALPAPPATAGAQTLSCPPVSGTWKSPSASSNPAMNPAPPPCSPLNHLQGRHPWFLHIPRDGESISAQGSEALREFGGGRAKKYLDKGDEMFSCPLELLCRASGR